MAVESAEDLAVFFDDEDFALSATWNGVTCSVLTRNPDEFARFGDGEIVVSSFSLMVRASEVSTPAAGDLVAIGERTWCIQGTPRIDAEHVIWTCQALPA